jgi:hypothetical protein
MEGYLVECTLYANIDGANGRTGKWTEDKDWAAIAALVPGRTKAQWMKT